MQEKPQASHVELDGVSRVVLRLAQADKDRPGLVFLWLILPNVVAPLPERLDDLWQDGGSEWDSDEDERFMHKVGQAKLCPNSWLAISWKSTGRISYTYMHRHHSVRLQQLLRLHLGNPLSGWHRQSALVRVSRLMWCLRPG